MFFYYKIIYNFLSKIVSRIKKSLRNLWLSILSIIDRIFSFLEKYLRISDRYILNLRRERFVSMFNIFKLSSVLSTKNWWEGGKLQIAVWLDRRYTKTLYSIYEYRLHKRWKELYNILTTRNWRFTQVGWGVYLKYSLLLFTVVLFWCTVIFLIFSVTILKQGYWNIILPSAESDDLIHVLLDWTQRVNNTRATRLLTWYQTRTPGEVPISSPHFEVVITTIEEPVLQTQLPLVSLDTNTMVSVGTSTDIVVSTTRGGDIFFEADNHLRQRVFELTSHQVCRTGNGPVQVPNGGPVQVPNGANGPVQVPNGGPVQVPNGGPVQVPNGANGPVQVPNGGPVQVPNGDPGQDVWSHPIRPYSEFGDVFPMFFPNTEKNIMDQVNDVSLYLDIPSKGTPPRTDPDPNVQSNLMRNCIFGFIGSCAFAYGLYKISGDSIWYEMLLNDPIPFAIREKVFNSEMVLPISEKTQRLK